MVVFWGLRGSASMKLLSHPPHQVNLSRATWSHAGLSSLALSLQLCGPRQFASPPAPAFPSFPGTEPGWNGQG
jgi:hypothetical protein